MLRVIARRQSRARQHGRSPTSGGACTRRRCSGLGTVVACRRTWPFGRRSRRSACPGHDGLGWFARYLPRRAGQPVVPARARVLHPRRGGAGRLDRGTWRSRSTTRPDRRCGPRWRPAPGCCPTCCCPPWRGSWPIGGATGAASRRRRPAASSSPSVSPPASPSGTSRGPRRRRLPGHGRGHPGVPGPQRLRPDGGAADGPRRGQQPAVHHRDAGMDRRARPWVASWSPPPRRRRRRQRPPSSWPSAPSCCGGCPATPVGRRMARPPSTSVLAALTDGVRALRRTGTALAVLLLILATNVIDGSAQVLLLLVADEQLDLGEGGYGLLTAVDRRRGPGRRRRQPAHGRRAPTPRSVAGRGRRRGARLCAARGRQVAPMAVALLALVSGASVVVEVVSVTILQRSVPPTHLARVFGLLDATRGRRHRGRHRLGAVARGAPRPHRRRWW